MEKRRLGAERCERVMDNAHHAPNILTPLRRQAFPCRQCALQTLRRIDRENRIRELKYNSKRRRPRAWLHRGVVRLLGWSRKMAR